MRTIRPLGDVPFLSRRAWLPAICALVAATIVLRGRAGAFGFYEDEGINLLKAYMVTKGHRLYGEIYSDHAPLFTWMMAGLMEIVGPVYQRVQMMAIGFGALAIASLSMIASKAGGWLAGGICFVVLLTLVPCQKFLASVVVTTPALGFAAAGIAVIVLVPSRSGAALLGGFLIGLATVTKLSFIYFLPVGLSYSVQRGRLVGAGGGGRSAALVLAGWIAPVAVTFLLCGTGAMIPQLIMPHFAALAAFAEQTNRALLLAGDLPVFYGCGVIAVAVLAATAFGRVWPLLGWTAIVAAWATVHRPIWSHHLPELLAPLAVAIGIALAELVRRALDGKRMAYLLSGAALCCAVSGWGGLHLQHYQWWRRFYNNTPIEALAAAADRLARHTVPADWIITDRPMTAFLAQRPVPPWLAMMSRKRVITGSVAEKELLAALAAYGPAATLLCGTLLDGFPRFLGVLQERYSVIEDPLAGTTWGAHGHACRLFRGREVQPRRDHPRWDGRAAR